MIRQDTHQQKCIYWGVEYILEQIYVSELGYVMYRLFDSKRVIWMTINAGHFSKAEGFSPKHKGSEILLQQMADSQDTHAAATI